VNAVEGESKVEEEGAEGELGQSKVELEGSNGVEGVSFVMVVKKGRIAIEGKREGRGEEEERKVITSLSSVL